MKVSTINFIVEQKLLELFVTLTWPQLTVVKILKICNLGNYENSRNLQSSFEIELISLFYIDFNDILLFGQEIRDTIIGQLYRCPSEMI